MITGQGRAWILLLLLTTTATLFTPLEPRAQAAQDRSASAAAQATLDRIVAVLETRSSRDTKITLIEGIVSDRFDFQTMSRLVAARAWRAMTVSQQQKFGSEFREHLAVTYGRYVDRYDGQTMVVVGERDEARGDRTVRTEIRGKNAAPISIVYRMRSSDGNWRIIDVIVEDISLVSNFRAQIAGLVSSRGVEGMLETLRRKNAGGKSILPDRNSVEERSRPSSAGS